MEKELGLENKETLVNDPIKVNKNQYYWKVKVDVFMIAEYIISNCTPANFLKNLTPKSWLKESCAQGNAPREELSFTFFLHYSSGKGVSKSRLDNFIFRDSGNLNFKKWQNSVTIEDKGWEFKPDDYSPETSSLAAKFDSALVHVIYNRTPLTPNPVSQNTLDERIHNLEVEADESEGRQNDKRYLYIANRHDPSVDGFQTPTRNQRQPRYGYPINSQHNEAVKQLICQNSLFLSLLDSLERNHNQRSIDSLHPYSLRNPIESCGSLLPQSPYSHLTIADNCQIGDVRAKYSPNVNPFPNFAVMESKLPQPPTPNVQQYLQANFCQEELSKGNIINALVDKCQKLSTQVESLKSVDNTAGGLQPNPSNLAFSPSQITPFSFSAEKIPNNVVPKSPENKSCNIKLIKVEEAHEVIESLENQQITAYEKITRNIEDEKDLENKNGDKKDCEDKEIQVSPADLEKTTITRNDTEKETNFENEKLLRIADLENEVKELRQREQGLEKKLLTSDRDLQSEKATNLRILEKLNTVVIIILVEQHQKSLEAYLQASKGFLSLYCRIRPLQAKEIRSELISIRESNTIVLSHKNLDQPISFYHFKHVFTDESTQEDVFSNLLPYVKRFLAGKGVCLLAYGPTGSGKTYTLNGSSADPGILPRIFQFLVGSDIQRTVYLSCCEIYNKTKIEPFGKNVWKVINNLETYKKIQKEIIKERKTSRTLMNEASSRSHLIYSLRLQKNSDITLTVVDLAGTEPADISLPDSTESESDTLAFEGRCIRESISLLNGALKELLVDRNSLSWNQCSLTQRLKNSVCNDQVLLLLTASPAANHLARTRDSLQIIKSIVL